MNKIKYNSDSMKLITLFESMTGAKVKDCISNADMRGSRREMHASSRAREQLSLANSLIFIMEENEMGKAIGKNGINIKRIENKLRKKVKLVEFSNNVLQFVKNMIYPIEIFEVKQENNDLIIHAKDTHTRAMLIGRERQNINHLSDIVRRYFNVKEMKVI